MIEGRPFPCPDVAMVTQISDIVGTTPPGGVVTENQRQPASRIGPPPVRSACLLGGPSPESSILAARSDLHASPLSCSSDKAISQKEGIEPSACKRLQGVIGRCHQRFLVIERRVENERNAGELSKAIDQRMEQRVLLRVDELNPAGSILRARPPG